MNPTVEANQLKMKYTIDAFARFVLRPAYGQVPQATEAVSSKERLWESRVLTPARWRREGESQDTSLNRRGSTAPLLAIVFTLLIAMCCSSAVAQSGAGSIQGTVTDPTGAVISGALVHVVQQDTNTTSDTKTNSVGFYQVPGLFTGKYGVTITAPGMKSYRIVLELLVEQHAAINAVMALGDVSQSVQVTSDQVQLITTDSGTISSTLENARINQLPMNGRSVTTLIGVTVPGVEGGTRANGLMGEALDYVADGVPLSNRQSGGVTSANGQLPDPDAVQEVRVETSNSSAMYAAPGTVIITTKSGTNQLHGSFFETARNNAFGIARSRQNPSNFAAPHLVRNEFGASAGGPIVLPHIYDGRNKSFWFFAFERYSLRSFTSENVYVPTPAMKRGDFSGLYNSSNQFQQLYDPNTTAPSANCNGTGQANQWCRAPFLNNQIPLSRLSPTAKALFDILPNPSNTNNPFVSTNLTTPGISNSTSPTITLRLDHQFSENNRAYLRYGSNNYSAVSLTNSPGNAPATLAADGIPAGVSGVSFLPSVTYSGAIGFTHIFSPSLVSETVLSQQWAAQHVSPLGNPNLNYEQMLGLPNNFGETGFPSFGSGDTILQNDLQGGQGNIYGLSQIVTTIDENLTKTLGRHQMQFGARYRHEGFGMIPNSSSDGVGIGAQGTGLEDPTTKTTYGQLSNTGNYLADLFIGDASGYSVSKPAPYVHFHDMEFDAYYQDNFRVTRKFTINLGLRYEAHPAIGTKDGIMLGLDLPTHNLVLPNPASYYVNKGLTTQAIVTNLQNLGVNLETPAQANMPAAILRNYDLTIAPRLGLAYQLFGDKIGTVLRAGYGRYIYPVPTRSVMNTVARYSPFEATYSQSYIVGNQSPDGLANYELRAPQTATGPLSSGTPIMGVNTANVVDTSSINAITAGSLNAYALNPNQPPDYVSQVNVTVEQALKGSSALRVSWLYVHGTNLDQWYYLNTLPSSYVWQMNAGTAVPSSYYLEDPYDNKAYSQYIYYEQKSGWSNDNALQASYQRLYHRGIAYQINYVWSKPFRVGGNRNNDNIIYPYGDFIGNTQGVMTSAYPVTAPNRPPSPSSGAPSYTYNRALNRFENYKVDTAIPLQRISFNGIVDLPFGRGKRYLSRVNRFVDEVVGGWQVAGDGTVVSQDFFVASANWGPTNPIHVYKHRAPITDCRTGNCYKAYEWFNGYLAPSVVNASSKGVTGLPGNWAPYSSPIDTNYNPATPGGTAQDPNYNTNNVNVTLLNGTTVQKVGFSPGPSTNPFTKTLLHGPMNYNADLSLFKVFPITKTVLLRANVDAFNAFNIQGYTNPNATDGTQQVQAGGVGASSYWTPRQLQFTLRLTF
ncbi:Carboxypeptidase regulatory-like domain-containing protein [Granulicella rosea]|uniref:Carboxypeptidase regulatory-like domain-containing protein n=1 Tax=Granulicella rosea TaxID=474952 RepID=A0A239E9N6_9BACT|nr:carboxypeptidase-like regulatory domain-containing protein [Granulicella rosea]SNS41189.1 Carboxypeptidase regulatory-like domain-containing protein [Granulicella rosea]